METRAQLTLADPGKSAMPLFLKQNSGVGDGNRTHNVRSHSPVLCQLSYSHRISTIIATSLKGCQKVAEIRLQTRSKNLKNVEQNPHRSFDVLHLPSSKMGDIGVGELKER